LTVSRLLVFGAGGQVGRELMLRAPGDGWQATGFVRAALDITRSADVARAIAEMRPAVVVNAAAYTAVDAAETDRDAAFAVNADAAGAIAAACARAGIPMVHISTDYVFDGRKEVPYVEDDAIAPLGVYGKSKAAGERAVRDVLARHVVLRTAAVFAAHGRNFVRTMLRLAGERPELRVVADQRTCPTAAADIAAAIVAICARLAQPQVAADAFGTFHFCGTPAVSWHGFAEAILDAASRRGWPRPPVAAIPTEAYPTPAQRPARSMLDCSKIARVYRIGQPDWRPALEDALAVLVGGEAAREESR
jgi:dTDP-4-dehydrorhamnose reductase